MGESNNPERERRILAAAADLIVRYGYDKTTVEEIARDAGISKGAVYLHFKSKEQLFEALLIRDSEAAIGRFYEMIEADPKDVTLFNIYRYTLVVADEMPLIKALYQRDRRVLGDFMRRQRDLPIAGRVANFSAEFVRQYQEAGLIRTDLDAGLIAYLLVALTNGIFALDTIIPGAELPPIAALGETLAEMLAHGLEPADAESDHTAGRRALTQLIDAKMDYIDQLHRASAERTDK